jgi:hypothetical protein
MEEIAYPQAIQIGSALAVTIATSETTLLTITDGKATKFSQITNYFDIVLGSASSVRLKYYFSPDNGTTWYQIPTRNTSTGVLVDTPSVADATSPAQTISAVSHIRVVEDIPFSGSLGYKVTGTAVAASATLTSISVYGRQN